MRPFDYSGTFLNVPMHYELLGGHRDGAVQVEIWVSREADILGKLKSYTFSPNMCFIL